MIGKRANALRVSRAAILPKNALVQSASLYPNLCSDTRPRSGVGLHALVGQLVRETKKFRPFLLIFSLVGIYHFASKI